MRRSRCLLSSKPFLGFLICAVQICLVKPLNRLRTTLSGLAKTVSIPKLLGKTLLVVATVMGGIAAICFLSSLFGPKADLYIDSIWLPERPQLGSNTAVMIRIGNKGKKDAGPFQVGLHMGEVEIPYFVSRISPTFFEEVKLSWTPKRAGPVEIQVFLDVRNVVQEADEANNMSTTSINVMASREEVGETKSTEAAERTSINVMPPRVLFTPSGVGYKLKPGEYRAFEFKILSVDFGGEISFGISQHPVIESGGVVVGGSGKISKGGETTVTGGVLTGGDTPPGFYQIEIQGEDEEGNFVGSFKIEVFVESNHEEGTVDEKDIDSSTPNERVICNGHEVCSSDIRMTVEPESISVGAHFCFVIENTGKEPRIIENLLVERPNGIIDTNPSLKGLELAPGDTLFFGEGYPSPNWRSSDDSTGGGTNQPGRYKAEVIFTAPSCQVHVSSTSSANVSQ